MMKSDLNQPHPQQALALIEDEIDLMDIARILWKGRFLIASFTVAGALVAGIINFNNPNVYTAAALIMPMDSSTDRMSSTMASLGAMGGLASQGNFKGSVSDKFVALLKTRTITENVISRHHMLPLIFADRWDPSRSVWKTSSNKFSSAKEAPGPTSYESYRFMQQAMSAIADPKTGIISIQAVSTKPQLAADIANNFVIELDAFLQGKSFSSTKNNRDFLEKQVQKTLLELGKVEGALKAFQEQHKLVSLDAQTDAAVQANASLKTQLTAKEMELSLQENSVSADDMEVIGLKKEISQIKEKIAYIENGASGSSVSFKDAPRLGMRFAQLKRDLLVKENVFSLLTQQLELAKVDEAKETMSFQVLDRAIPPDQKSGPKRSANILMAALASFFAGALLAFGADKFSLFEKSGIRNARQEANV